MPSDFLAAIWSGNCPFLSLSLPSFAAHLNRSKRKELKGGGGNRVTCLFSPNVKKDRRSTGKEWMSLFILFCSRCFMIEIFGCYRSGWKFDEHFFGGGELNVGDILILRQREIVGRGVFSKSQMSAIFRKRPKSKRYQHSTSPPFPLQNAHV